MPCPVCVADAIVIMSCRFFGIPDVITTFFLGIATLSLAIVTLRWLKGMLLLDDAPRGSLLIITAAFSALALLSMWLVGMF